MIEIHLQLHPRRAPALDLEPAIARLSALDAGSRVTRGDDDGPYVNLGFRPADARALWRAIHAELAADRQLAGATIVICQGRRGWDDYLLLHHFDPTQPLDQLD